MWLDEKVVCYLALLVIQGAILFVLGNRLGRSKRNKRHPLYYETNCRRPAGESTRQKLEELYEQWDDTMGWALLSFIVAIFFIALAPAKPIWLARGLCGLGVAVAFGEAMFLWKKAPPLLKGISNYNLGLDGERFVGQLLTDELVTQGCFVFHDVLFDKFNIDHVVVTPTGVFSIETKTWRKPLDKKTSAPSFEITYDGQRLYFPMGINEGGALEQARRNAQTLSRFLAVSIGQPIAVRPVLVFPGWFVTAQSGPVIVMNPKNCRANLLNQGQPLLPSEIFNRVTFVLNQKNQYSYR